MVRRTNKGGIGAVGSAVRSIGVVLQFFMHGDGRIIRFVFPHFMGPNVQMLCQRIKRNQDQANIKTHYAVDQRRNNQGRGATGQDITSFPFKLLKIEDCEANFLTELKHHQFYCPTEERGPVPLELPRAVKFNFQALVHTLACTFCAVFLYSS